jgi:hypothetical protein
MVIMSHFLITISGQSTSFHEPMKVVMPTVTSDGFGKGPEDLEQYLVIGASVDPRRIHQLLRERPEELAEYDDPHVADHGGDYQCLVRVGPTQSDDEHVHGY